MAQLGSSALGAPRIYPWHHPWHSPWHRTILGAKVPTQLHSLEEVASFTKKKIVDFKLRWMTDGWQDHWQWGNSGNTVPALQVWDLAKVPLVDLTWCQSLMKSAIFSRPKHRRFDGIRQHKMVSHQVHYKDLRVAEAQKEREDLMTSRAMETTKRTKKHKKKCFPEVFQLSCEHSPLDMGLWSTMFTTFLRRVLKASFPPSKTWCDFH